MRSRGKKDRVTEEFCLKNFLHFFNKYPDIPILLLVEPLINLFNDRIKGERKQGGSQHKPGNLSSEEINFINRICQHPKLNQNSALQILELLATIYVSRPKIASAILDSIIDIIQKY